MGMNELHTIEVVLTYMDGEAVMLVKSSPTNDYDSAVESNAWISRAKTGRCRAIAMTPITGVRHEAKDATTTPEPRCPMGECTLGPGHSGLHQDKKGETWQEVDILGNRIVDGSPVPS